MAVLIIGLLVWRIWPQSSATVISISKDSIASFSVSGMFQNFETGNFDFSGNSNNTGDKNAQSQEKTATVGLHQAVKAFDEGAVAIEKNIYSGNGIHLVI